jgi:outer membrane protein TolC
VTLGASAGFEGSSILNWLNWPSRFWAVGPSLVQTLFDAGRRRAGFDAAMVHAFDSSQIMYGMSDASVG